MVRFILHQNRQFCPFVVVTKDGLTMMQCGWILAGSFMLYAAVNVLAVVFVIKVVPETKGRTLEQIQAAISSS